jgi:long-subunit fatty acid transport protein
MAGDAGTIALATTIQPTKKLLVSVGSAYSKFMYSDRNGYYTKAGAYEVMNDDNVNVNTGFSYKVTGALAMTVGYMHTFYKTQNTKAMNAQPMDVDVKVKNSLDAIAIGVNLQF